MATPAAAALPVEPYQSLQNLEATLTAKVQKGGTLYLKVENSPGNRHVKVVDGFFEKTAAYLSTTWLRHIFSFQDYRLDTISDVLVDTLQKAKERPNLYNKLTTICKPLFATPLEKPQLANAPLNATVASRIQIIWNNLPAASPAVAVPELAPLVNLVIPKREQKPLLAEMQKAANNPESDLVLIDTMIDKVDKLFLTLNLIKPAPDESGSLFHGTYTKISRTITELLDEVEKASPEDRVRIWHKNEPLLTQFLHEAKCLLNAKGYNVPGQEGARTRKSVEQSERALQLMALRSFLLKAELVAKENGIQLALEPLFAKMGASRDRVTRSFTEETLQSISSVKLIQLKLEFYKAIQPIERYWRKEITTKSALPLKIKPLHDLKAEFDQLTKKVA